MSKPSPFGKFIASGNWVYFIYKGDEERLPDFTGKMIVYASNKSQTRKLAELLNAAIAGEITLPKKRRR